MSIFNSKDRAAIELVEQAQRQFLKVTRTILRDEQKHEQEMAAALGADAYIELQKVKADSRLALVEQGAAAVHGLRPTLEGIIRAKAMTAKAALITARARAEEVRVKQKNAETEEVKATSLLRKTPLRKV